MNPNPVTPTDLSGLEMDLLKSFQPSWVKESSPADKLARLSTQADDRRREQGMRPDGDDSQYRWDRKPPKTERLHRRHPEEHPDKLRRPGGEKSRGPKKPLQRMPSRQDSDPSERLVPLEGWEVKFQPESRGIDGLLKQIKSSAKAYAIFDLARLVLEKSPRYTIAFRRTNGPAFFQVVADGTLWLTESEAVTRVITAQLGSFYRSERRVVEPPKGSYPLIAQCGMSGVFLGPPNHHDYQLKIRKLHGERFANVPFDIYKARIRMVRDEESIQKWRDEQSHQEVYQPLDAPEGTEPLTLGSLAEVEEHFRKNYIQRAIITPGDSFTVPGPAAVNDSTPAVIEFVRRELDNLIRFPLPLAHILSKELSSGGLQIFKAHENVTYVSIARPRLLDRQATPVSESLSAILDYLESHAGKPRAEQWRALLELRPLPPDGDAAQRESALLRDFHWLLLQGHVVDYATKGLEIPRRQPARPPQPPAKPREKKPARAALATDPTDRANAAPETPAPETPAAPETPLA
jgi:hypothetical protein